MKVMVVDVRNIPDQAALDDLAKEHDHPARVMYAPPLADRMVVLEDTPEILCVKGD